MFNAKIRKIKIFFDSCYGDHFKVQETKKKQQYNRLFLWVVVHHAGFFNFFSKQTKSVRKLTYYANDPIDVVLLNK